MVPAVNHPTTIKVHSQAQMSMAHSNAINRRNKHIDVRFQFTPHLVTNGTLRLKYCNTDEMLADLLTKAFYRVKLQASIQKVGMISATVVL